MKHWPWIAAGVVGVVLAYAADNYLKRYDTIPVQPLPEPVGAFDRGPEPEQPSQPPAEPSQPPFRPVPPPSPQQQQERDRAIQRLEVQGFQPGAEALVRASREGIDFAINLLLKMGVDPNARNGGGETPLAAACQAGRCDVARKLLEAGADGNLSDPAGRTPLMLAAARDNLELMELLFQHGADLAATDPEGQTALHVALEASARKALEWLLLQSSQQELLTGEARDELLDRAVRKGDLQLLEPVIQFVKPRQWSTVRRNALMDAMREQNRDLARLLITHHEEAPTPEGAAQPLLGYTIAWGDPAALRFLLECGADPNTPLKSPVEPKFAELVKEKFIKHYLTKEGGVTPLMLAAGTGNLECVEALLEYGARKNAVTSKSKFAALSFAARTSPEIQQVLLGKSPRPEDQRITVEISLATQTARVYRDGQVVLTSPVSTGKPGYRTPTGRFVITDKQRVRISSLYHCPMEWFMRLSCSAVGMHAGVVPGYPASHGCIRLPYHNAVKFYKMLDVGTLVTIR